MNANRGVIFIASFLVTLLFIFAAKNPSISPYATLASKEDISALVNIISADNALKMLSADAQICLAVENGDETYYYNAVSDGQKVSVSEKYCADPGQDNIIAKFNSYEDILAFRSGPLAFITGKKNTGYYIFPSNHVAVGGEISCTPDFQTKYCPALYYSFTKQDMASMDLVCCANYELTADELAKINSLKKGPVAEKPGFFFSTAGIIMVILVLVGLVVGSSVLVSRKKSPLDEYVKQAKAQGFSKEEVQEGLKQSEWDEKTIEKAIKDVFK